MQVWICGPVGTYWACHAAWFMRGQFPTIHICRTQFVLPGNPLLIPVGLGLGHKRWYLRLDHVTAISSYVIQCMCCDTKTVDPNSSFDSHCLNIKHGKLWYKKKSTRNLCDSCKLKQRIKPCDSCKLKPKMKPKINQNKTFVIFVT